MPVAVSEPRNEAGVEFGIRRPVSITSLPPPSKASGSQPSLPSTSRMTDGSGSISIWSSNWLPTMFSKGLSSGGSWPVIADRPAATLRLVPLSPNTSCRYSTSLSGRIERPGRRCCDRRTRPGPYRTRSRPCWWCCRAADRRSGSRPYRCRSGRAPGPGCRDPADGVRVRFQPEGVVARAAVEQIAAEAVAQDVVRRRRR